MNDFLPNERPSTRRLQSFHGMALVGCVSLICSCAGWADDVAVPKQLSRGQRELSISVGFASNLQIPPSPNRSRVQFATVTQSYGWFNTGHREILLEVPFIVSTRSENHGGIGFNAMVRHHFSRKRSFAPFFEIGGGILGTNLRVKELGGSIQFTPQGGIGFRVSRRDNSDFIFGARFHHISNAGIRRPNVGLNSLLFFVGVTKSLSPKHRHESTSSGFSELVGGASKFESAPILGLDTRHERTSAK